MGPLDAFADGQSASSARGMILKQGGFLPKSISNNLTCTSSKNTVDQEPKEHMCVCNDDFASIRLDSREHAIAPLHKHRRFQLIISCVT